MRSLKPESTLNLRRENQKTRSLFKLIGNDKEEQGHEYDRGVTFFVENADEAHEERDVETNDDSSY